MKKAKIVKIIRGYKNGMYKDKYWVYYESGRRVYADLKKTFEMPKTHFDFIMNAKCTPRYNKRTGEHIDDIFTA